MIKTLATAWDKFWFSSSNRYQYGIFRLILVAGLFFVSDQWQFPQLGGLAKAPGDFTAPTFLMQLLHLTIPIAPRLVSPLWWAVRLVAFTSAVGLLTRPSLIILACLNLYLNALTNSFGFIDHATTLPSLVLVVLAFAPGVTEFSLDSVIRHVRAHGWKLPERLQVFEKQFPVWPVNLILVVMALAYFTAGYSKIKFGSLAWMDGKTLTAYLTEPHPAEFFQTLPVTDPSLKWRDGVGLVSFNYSTGDPTPLAHLLAQSGLIMLLLSIFSVVWEVTFPIVLVFRRLLPLYLLAGAAFHIGIMATLSLYSFYAYLLCYLVFVDWRWIARPILKRFQVVVGTT